MKSPLHVSAGQLVLQLLAASNVVMAHTQRLLNKIPPLAIRLFISLSIIAAIAIIGLVLVTL